MFDPKGDDRKLISDKWIPIKDQVELSMLVRYMRSNYHFHPVLWRVLDPDNDFYGYIYSARQDVVMKVVDDQTMWVDDLPLPPYDPINFRPRSFGPVLEAIWGIFPWGSLYGYSLKEGNMSNENPKGAS